MAEILRGGTGARCSHLTAAWLWELVELPPRRHEISAARGTRLRNPSVRVHESRDLHLDVPGEVRGLPVTGVARTILDCAARPDVDLELLVDRARRIHDLSPGALPDVVIRHGRPGRAGVPRLRALVADGAMPDSDFERFFLRFLADRAFADPVLHHRVRLGSGKDAVLDLAWPELRVAIELDGSDHWKRRAVFEADRVRQNHLVNSGWLVLRFTWRQFVTDPDGVAAQIAAALDRVRAHERGSGEHHGSR